jgi:hypothetical protein
MSISPGTPQPTDPNQGATPAPVPGAPTVAAPAPQQGTNGLAVAGLILAFLIAPIGFILSLIALIQTGKRRQKGRGLAIAGVIVSVLAMASTITIIAVVFATVGKNVTTVADPGCTSGKDAIMKMASAPSSSEPETMKAQLQTVINELNTAAAKAKHDNVRDAMKAVADDYSQLVKAFNTGTEPPADLMDKITTDANKIDELCTIGGAKK